MELFYRKYGQGEAIIILHGLFGMSDNWVSIAKKLGENYEVFLPDMRNHGQSPHSDTFNFSTMSDDILEFIDFHYIQKPILIGHSMGGKVAMNLALDNNELPKAIIVVDIRPGPYTEHYEHLELIDAVKSVDLAAAKSYSDIDKQLSAFPLPLRLRQFILKNIRRNDDNTFSWKFNIDAIRLNLNNMLLGIDDVNIHKVKGNLKTLDHLTYPGPALFIKGGESDYIKPQDFPIIKNLFPASEIITINGASHWVHEDKPAELLEIVSSFIGSI